MERKMNGQKDMFRVGLCSTEDDSEGSFYHHLNEEEQAVIRAWRDLPEDDELHGCLLEEYLEEKGYHALVERLLVNDSEYELNLIKSCDLDDRI